ncbi:hypothetical protein WJX74_006155 [Apatococcus lobatus]|uniref:COX assembly mitochondrial protein n=1 Tax=Apatococcus lobatus TaxID=904363 RepID=A0AAW1QUW7_9CHLO
MSSPALPPEEKVPAKVMKALNYRLRRHASALCKDQAEALQQCMADRGFSAVYFCRPQNEDYKLCMKRHYNAERESELARRYMATGQGAPLEEQDWDSILKDL